MTPVSQALIAVTIASVGLAGPPTTPLAPLSPWGSYEESHRCTVERTFGAGPGGTFGMKLGFSPFGYPLDGDFIVRTRAKPVALDSVTITLDDRPPDTFPARVIFLEKQGIAIFRVERTTDAFWQGFRRSRAIRVSVGERIVTEASYAAADKVADAAEACARKRFQAWGGDLDLRASGTPPVMRDTRWSQVGDYPQEALNQGAVGRVFAYYRVMPDGRAHDCTVVRSSRSKVLDRETCARLMKRAQFTPGRDASGQAVPWVSGIDFSWQIDDSDWANDLFLGSFIGAGQPAGTVQ